MQDNVIFEPWTDDLFSYYKTAGLFLLVSNYEGYGRTVVEAMAAGCPVITTDVGIAGDVVIDPSVDSENANGLVVPVGDRERLKEAILRMINDKIRRLEMKNAAENKVSLFPTKEEYLEKYKKHWQECLL